MTLTELKYVVALAQERHFGRAAQKCFVTQPTLSLALAKLEDELGVKLFERNKNEVLVTARGQAIVEQARRVLDEAGKIQGIAAAARTSSPGRCAIGAIPTIGPYLLPELVPILQQARARHAAVDRGEPHRQPGADAARGRARRGHHRAAVLAPGVKTDAVYEEPFSVVVPEGHDGRSASA
jgi:LysR family hydrogen peroxide-inducible transcriptional activator